MNIIKTFHNRLFSGLFESKFDEFEAEMNKPEKVYMGQEDSDFSKVEVPVEYLGTQAYKSLFQSIHPKHSGKVGDYDVWYSIYEDGSAKVELLFEQYGEYQVFIYKTFKLPREMEYIRL